MSSASDKPERQLATDDMKECRLRPGHEWADHLLDSSCRRWFENKIVIPITDSLLSLRLNKDSVCCLSYAHSFSVKSSSWRDDWLGIIRASAAAAGDVCIPSCHRDMMSWWFGPSSLFFVTVCVPPSLALFLCVSSSDCHGRHQSEKDPHIIARSFLRWRIVVSRSSPHCQRR